MIELIHNELIFSFPELREGLRRRVHAWVDARVARATPAERAKLPSPRERLYREFSPCIPEIRGTVEFHRTLRIPDDGKDYSLPPGLGNFPLRHVDDFEAVPENWKTRGGVMLPMHKAEAMWLGFSADCPMALKIGAGGICAVSGERWATSLQSVPQNYVVLDYQPWLDGFRISPEVVRQFVAMPLGKGFTVEHQLTGQETWGGLQLQAFTQREEAFWSKSLEASLERTWKEQLRPRPHGVFEGVRCSSLAFSLNETQCGFAAGGRMKQTIIADPYGVATWDTTLSSRCFVHLALAEDWQRFTGAPPPQPPPTAADYTQAGLPWFDYDAGMPAVAGTTVLSGVKSLNPLLVDKTSLGLADNATIAPENVLSIPRRRVATVREF